MTKKAAKILMGIFLIWLSLMILAYRILGGSFVPASDAKDIRQWQEAKAAYEQEHGHL